MYAVFASEKLKNNMPRITLIFYCWGRRKGGEKFWGRLDEKDWRKTCHHTSLNVGVGEEKTKKRESG